MTGQDFFDALTKAQESIVTISRIEVDCGGWNTSITVTATKDGLQIGHELITWAAIDEARQKALTDVSPRARQPQT